MGSIGVFSQMFFPFFKFVPGVFFGGPLAGLVRIFFDWVTKGALYTPLGALFFPSPKGGV